MNFIFKEGKRELVLLILLYYLTKNPKLILSLFLFLVLFFRAPSKQIVQNRNEILSPSYGTIDSIEYYEDSTKINILLDISDVHVQYIPYPGQVKYLEHVPGNLNPFFLFSREKTDNNERFVTVLDTTIGTMVVIQYAGMIARRIVNNLVVGDNVQKGDIFGMIKFSSRVDIILPSSCKINVKQGDKVFGSKTILALH